MPIPAGLPARSTARSPEIEQRVGAGFGDAANPLLVSVRSGAPASMPGMMDTVLNLGLNDRTVEGLAERSSDRRFAFDSYRRFIQMYGSVVLGIEHYYFEDLLENHKLNRGVILDTEIAAEGWESLVGQYKDLVEERLGSPFPQDERDQLWGAIGAVFASWMNRRAVTYRSCTTSLRIGGRRSTCRRWCSAIWARTARPASPSPAIPRPARTSSMASICRTRRARMLVAGIRTPRHLGRAAREAAGSDAPSMEESMPAVFGELCRMPRHARGPLPRRAGHRVHRPVRHALDAPDPRGEADGEGRARAACEMVEEGLIDRAEAVAASIRCSIDQLLHPTLDPAAPRKPFARGMPASPGAASGRVVFNADEAEARSKSGEQVILVRAETSPEDIHGMHAALGILTSRGGSTSHAAVVARGMGRPCVVGASELLIDYGRSR